MQVDRFIRAECDVVHGAALLPAHASPRASPASALDTATASRSTALCSSTFAPCSPRCLFLPLPPPSLPADPFSP